jgi:hypothetical protein
VPEYQCRPHGGDYSMRGLANMRVDPILDPVSQRLVAWHTRMNFQEMERTIWMDGRPPPPDLAAQEPPSTGTTWTVLPLIAPLLMSTLYFTQVAKRVNGESKSEIG